MTKAELSQIYYINKELKMWRKELERIQSKSFVKAQQITGMPFGTGKTDNTANRSVEEVEIQEMIANKLKEIESHRRKIMEYINNVDDSLLRQIIYYRNVSCMSWVKIGNELGISHDSARKIYSRNFKKK